MYAQRIIKYYHPRNSYSFTLNSQDNLPHLKNFSKLSPHFILYWHCPRSGPGHLSRMLCAITLELVLMLPSSPFSITFHSHQPSLQNRTNCAPAPSPPSNRLCYSANSWAGLIHPVFQTHTPNSNVSCSLHQEFYSDPPIWNNHLLSTFHSTQSTRLLQHLPQVINDCLYCWTVGCVSTTFGS